MTENNTQNSSTIWRTAGGDASRRGLFPQSVSLNPTPIHRLSAQGSVQASAVFDRKGTVWIADMAGGVQAFTAEGKELWRVCLEGGISATPLLSPEEDRLFVGTFQGWIYALNCQDGTTVWRKEIPSKSDTRILSDLLWNSHSRVLVLNSWGGKFVALHGESGETAFSWDAGISPYSGASADREGMMYCLRAVWDKGVQIVRITSTGEETILYTQSLQNKPASRIPVAAAPVLDEERGIVYLITNLDRECVLHAWDSKKGESIWNHRFGRNIVSTPSLTSDGWIVVTGLDGLAYALTPEGEIAYRYASGCEYLLSGTVCDSAGNVYLGDPLGMIHRIDKNGIGQPFYEGDRAIQARPSFDPSGRLYVSSTDHFVYVFDNKLI